LLQLFASSAGKKLQQKDRSSDGLALQTSQSGVSQQNDHASPHGGALFARIAAIEGSAMTLVLIVGYVAAS
jgi:hypothetical protein